MVLVRPNKLSPPAISSALTMRALGFVLLGCVLP